MSHIAENQEIDDQVGVYSFNLLARNYDTAWSLEEIIKEDYSLELLTKHEIKKNASQWINSRQIGALARRVVRKIEVMEAKRAGSGSVSGPESKNQMVVVVEKKKEGSLSPSTSNSSSSSTSSSTSSPTGVLHQQKQKASSAPKVVLPSLSEDMIASKRTQPVKFVAKRKEAISVAAQGPIAPNQRVAPFPPLQNKKLEEERRLQKFLENKRALEEKKKAAQAQVSKVMNTFDEARLKRKEEALKARQQGFWDEQPKSKKGKFQYRK